MTSFMEAPVVDRLLAAAELRSALTLSAQDVGDLVSDLPDEDVVMERWIERLSVVDVKTLKVPVNARRAIERALSLAEGDLWP